MSLYDDVDREALHDWLNEREALAADERPDPSEYEEPRPRPTRPNWCPKCGQVDVGYSDDCWSCGWER